MYSRYFVILYIFFIAFACKSSPKVETVEAKDNDGYTERYQRRKSDYAKEGLYVKTDPQGAKVEEAMYKSDTLDGWRIIYYETGDTQVLESYRQGLFEGAYRVYYPGGKTKLSGTYSNNEMNGLWKGFYENGALKEEVTFANNQENGPFVEYYPNGKLKAQGSYLDGDNEHGELKLYNEAGVHIKTMECDKGICKTIWEVEKGD
ncbi:MAG: toxin-antitoxin system YwqK family antitoxin [Saprospiraceae bacterium]|nr:toxin-antitoxin system YwqK family antitoxin [Saprospiraceae bacterium]